MSHFWLTVRAVDYRQASVGPVLHGARLCEVMRPALLVALAFAIIGTAAGRGTALRQVRRPAGTEKAPPTPPAPCSTAFPAESGGSPPSVALIEPLEVATGDGRSAEGESERSSPQDLERSGVASQAEPISQENGMERTPPLSNELSASGPPEIAPIDGEKERWRKNSNAAAVAVPIPPPRAPKTQAHPTRVQHIEVDGESLPVEGGTPLSIVGPKLMRLSLGRAPFEGPVSPVYRWRLDQEASDWAAVDSGRAVTIVNPTVGSHTLRLQARDATGQWHDGKPLRFSILPPHWWDRGLFRGTAAFLAIALPALAIHIFHRRRSMQRRRIEAAARKINAERSQISRDLHDDLGNRLSELHLLAERAETVTLPGRPCVRQRLKGRTVEAIASLDQLVWLLNPRHDSWASLARMIEREGSDYLETASIASEFVQPATPPPQPPEPSLRRAVLLTHREMLHNVVQHSGATQATICLAVDRETVTLEVVDNGLGFDVKTALAEGRGLAELRRRAAEFDGALTAVSQAGRSSIKVSFSREGRTSRPLAV